jgi:hypothetical protein
MSTAARARDVEQALLDQLPLDLSFVRCRVEGDDARFEREAPCQVRSRASDVGHRNAVDLRDRVVAQSWDVAPQRTRRLTRRRGPARDVHVVEAGAPRRHAEQNGR